MTIEEAKTLKPGDVVICENEPLIKKGIRLEFIEQDEDEPEYGCFYKDGVSKWAQYEHVRRPETIDDVYEGALISNGTFYRRVLGVCGQAVFMAFLWEKNEPEDKRSDSSAWSIQELKDTNYQLVKEWEEEKPKSKSEQISEEVKRWEEEYDYPFSKLEKKIKKILGEGE